MKAVLALALMLAYVGGAGLLLGRSAQAMRAGEATLTAGVTAEQSSGEEKKMSKAPEGKQDWAAVAKDKLTPEQYDVCFLAGTEPPGSGKYDKLYDAGMYYCAVCGAPLFSSETKYNSHSGWPAFWDAADAKNIELLADDGHGMLRTEVRCKVCGAHLGHVFDDGPQPTGKRYCINSLALEFKAAGQAK